MTRDKVVDRALTGYYLLVLVGIIAIVLAYWQPFGAPTTQPATCTELIQEQARLTPSDGTPLLTNPCGHPTN